MSRKIPNKPFAATAEVKSTDTAKKTTSPATSRSKKAPTPVPAQAPVAPSSYRGGFQFIGLLLLIVLAGTAGYYGVPAVSQAINPTPVNRVTFNDTILNYQVGDTGRLVVSVQGEYTRNDVRWVSSDYSILDVDPGGNIFAKATGTVIIRAFVGNGSIQDTVVINVTEPSE